MKYEIINKNVNQLWNNKCNQLWNMKYDMWNIIRINIKSIIIYNQ